MMKPGLELTDRRHDRLGLALCGCAFVLFTGAASAAVADSPTYGDETTWCDDYSDTTAADVEGVEVAQLGSTCQQVDGRQGFGNLSGNISPGYGRLTGSCGGSGGEYIIQWVPDATGPVCFDTTGTDSNVDTVVYVQRQCGVTGTELACNDDPTTGGLQAMTEVYVQAGQPYYIIVDSYSNYDSYQPFILNARQGTCGSVAPTPPTPSYGAAGSCAQPHEINGFGALNVTIPPNNAAIAGQCGGSGAEYVTRWTAEQSGPVCFSSAGTETDTVVYVRSHCIAEGTELVCNDDPPTGGLQGEVTVQVQSGSSYFVVVDTYSNEGRALPAVLNVTQGACSGSGPAPQPGGVGSTCSTAHAVNGYGSLDVMLPGTTGGMAGSCGGSGSEYVLAWEADMSGEICISTPDTEVDTVVYVQRQCGNSSTEIACNDDPPTGGVQAQTQATVQAGQTYYVVVDQYFATGGPVTVTIQSGACDVGGPGGVCEPPEILASGPNASMNGTTAPNANSTAGTCGSNSGPDVAHLFRPTTSSTYCASTAGSSFDTILYVREGSCEASGNELACNDDSGGLQSQVEFSARAGQEYYVIVDSYGDASGRYSLNISQGPCAGGSAATTSSCDAVALSNYRVGATRYFCTSPAYFSIDSSASVDVQVEVGTEGRPGYLRIPWHLEPGTNNVRLHANPSSLNQTFMGDVRVTPICNRGGQRVNGTAFVSDRRLVFGKQACDFFRANRSQQEEQPATMPTFSNSGEGK